ncbi:hypothetical protein AB4160_18160, partial [Shewanella sp. 10N.286.51.B8]|uniref:hypothetical protein n=1 Tax=Shewanella sp. 10N.286.51.B8 TaxID=3229708 RepID=UPI0035524AFB
SGVLMLLAASLAKASISFLFMSICLSLTLYRVRVDKQLHKISYSLNNHSNNQLNDYLNNHFYDQFKQKECL